MLAFVATQCNEPRDFELRYADLLEADLEQRLEQLNGSSKAPDLESKDVWHASHLLICTRERLGNPNVHPLELERFRFLVKYVSFYLLDRRKLLTTTIHLKRWIHHFLPSEMGGAAAAILAALSTFAITQRVGIAVAAASIAETLAFYTVALVREHRRNDRLRTSLHNVLIDFGPAEVLDTLFIRPGAMYAFEHATNNLLLGVVFGKLASDLAFYAIAIPSHELRRKLRTQVDNSPATPHLQMDLDVVRDRYNDFRHAFSGTQIHYAMKCNPDERVLRTLHAQGSGFEVASAAELDMLIAIGVDPAEVLFSNPVKRSSEIARAHDAGVWRFAADSPLEIEKLARNAPGCAVFLRLATTPSAHNEVASEGKFGISEDHVCDLARLARVLGLKPYGIAFHVGSQMLDPFAWEPAIAAAGRVMRELQHDGIAFVGLDVGGGFPIPYEDELVPAVQEYADVIRKSMDVHLPYDVQCFIEPGRALVAEAGTMVASVVGIAHRNGKRWVHLDVGAFNGMMEALETGNKLRFPLSDSLNGDTSPCHVTGPSCDSQDTILFDAELSTGLSESDIVNIHCAGAYTTSYASTFNGFEIPETNYRS